MNTDTFNIEENSILYLRYLHVKDNRGYIIYLNIRQQNLPHTKKKN